MRQHGGASSQHNQAVFAFDIAKAEASGRGIDIDSHQPRRALDTNAVFADLFRQARARVATMDMRFVEIDDPELRTVYEVHAAVAFGTFEFNSFDTH